MSLGFDTFGQEQLSGLGGSYSEDLEIWVPPDERQQSTPAEQTAKAGKITAMVSIVSVVILALLLLRK